MTVFDICDSPGCARLDARLPTTAIKTLASSPPYEIARQLKKTPTSSVGAMLDAGRGGPEGRHRRA